MEKKNKLLLISLLALTILILGIYFYFAIQPMPLEEYLNNPPCEFKQLENGFTQLENCVRYKLKGTIPNG